MITRYRSNKIKRRTRVRRNLPSGRPRLSVFRSQKNIYAQIIDDTLGKTIIAANSKQLGDKDKTKSKMEQANLVGKLLADKAQKSKTKKVVFDRGHYQFHGRVKALASAARNSGLKF